MGRGRSADAGRRGPLGRRLERVTALCHCCGPAFDNNLCRMFRCPGLPGFP